MTPVRSAASVREATFELARSRGLTTWFGNPGSTEIPLLAGLPGDLRYVLALHESAAAGMATGYALAAGRPAMVSLHTTAGLGNAVSALASARAIRAPLVVLVGQQDRRHLLAEPFLTGRLAGLAGSYPLDVLQPPRAPDVPGCIAQAWHAAQAGRGPVIVIVPMGDWDEAAEDLPVPAPARSRSASGADPGDVAAIGVLLDAATSPVLVTGAGADSAAAWSALTGLADRLDCPVFSEPFSARAGYPQDHPRFAGFLPAGRAALRRALAPYDTVVVIGGALLRQYHYEPGSLVGPATRTAVISEDPAEVGRSPVDFGLIAPLPAAVMALTRAVAPGAARRDGRPPPTGQADALRSELAGRAGRAAGLTAETLFAEIAGRVTADTIVVEETPSSQDEAHLMIPARRPLGLLRAPMGGLGFGLPAAIGVRMALPRRPVLGLIGDGSSLYCIQALWTAAHYGVGVVFFVLSNGRYQVMHDLIGERGPAPWPPLSGVSVDGLAAALGVASLRVTTREQLTEVAADVLPGLRHRDRPLVVTVALDAS
jgi:benzoylformate decarboxylase